MKNEYVYTKDTAKILSAFSAGLIVATPTDCLDVEQWIKYENGKVMSKFCYRADWVENKRIATDVFEKKAWRIVCCQEKKNETSQHHIQR